MELGQPRIYYSIYLPMCGLAYSVANTLWGVALRLVCVALCITFATDKSD